METTVKVPCIIINNYKDWNYIKEKLESFGYYYTNINIHNIINSILIINCSNIIGAVSNFTYRDNPLNRYNRYLLNDIEEFLKEAAKLKDIKYNPNNMETRNITIDLETAKKWFNSEDKTLKELALQAYKEEELIDINYNYIAKELFKNKIIYLINKGEIIYNYNEFYNHNYYKNINNCTSKKQCEKLLAINKLLNVAKYLNKKEVNDNDTTSMQYNICYNIDNDSFFVEHYQSYNNNIVSFKTKELAEQAIEILGKETLKLIFCNDY